MQPSAAVMRVSVVWNRGVIRARVSRCEISYLLHGQVAQNFNLRGEMKRVAWEHGGLSRVVVPGKCFIKTLPCSLFIFLYFGWCAD